MLELLYHPAQLSLWVLALKARSSSFSGTREAAGRRTAQVFYRHDQKPDGGQSGRGSDYLARRLEVCRHCSRGRRSHEYIRFLSRSHEQSEYSLSTPQSSTDALRSPASQRYFVGYQPHEEAYKDRAIFCRGGSRSGARLVEVCLLCYNSSTFAMLQRKGVL